MRRVVFLILFFVAACTQQSWNDRLASPEEQRLALQIADQLRGGQLATLTAEAAPELRSQLPAYLRQATPMLALVHGTFSLQTVSSFAVVGAPTTKTFIFQGGSGTHWALVRVVLQGSGQATRLIGLNVTPVAANPSQINNFDIGRRGVAGFIWLALMAASVCTCIVAVVLIWRGRWLKRRWLWTIGSLLGVAGFWLNWSTGDWAVSLASVSLLGAQATMAGPFAPWLVSFGFPVIALIVIVRWYRREPGADPTGEPAW